MNAGLGEEGQEGFLKAVSVSLQPVKDERRQLSGDRRTEGGGRQQSSRADTLWAGCSSPRVRGLRPRKKARPDSHRVS